MKKHIGICAAVIAATFNTALAEIPSNYYSGCVGKSGQQLVSALHNVINNHTVVSYDGLYDLYETSDVRDDGTIWDMYSTKHWNRGERCGNYSGIGSCYNREHSFPKSWFGGKVSPMYSDAFHLYPTDGQVNGYRSNYPYGECSGGTTWKTGNIQALGRLGSSTFPGYSGTVFEPDDEYKGDFARSYFYMATCYYDRIASWNSEMLAGNSFPAFQNWALQLLLKWHKQDPVSTKELNRNEAVYAAQHNRNPFIDYPELVDHIWGEKSSQGWDNSAARTPEIILPVNGTTVDMGMASSIVEGDLTAVIALRAAALDAPVTITSSNSLFTVTPATVPAADATAGKDIRLTFSGKSKGDYSTTLTFRSGSATSTVTATAKVIGNIPLWATDITPEEFVLNWTSVSANAGRYFVEVTNNGHPVAGSPFETEGTDHLTIDGLTPATTYSCRVYLADGTTSETITVRTADPTPVIRLLFDSELNFVAKQGMESEIAEILVEAEYIPGVITVNVDPPFRVSTDRATWREYAELQPNEDRFYMMMLGDEPGIYSTAIEVRADEYFNDDAMAEGVVTATEFVETFERLTELSSYGTGLYEGMACSWNVTSGNIWEADTTFNGSLTLRLRNGALEMAEDKAGGLGTLTVDLRKWGNDAEAVVAVEASGDGGAHWNSYGTLHAALQNDFVTETCDIKLQGSGRLRLRMISGNRLNIDNLRISDYSGTTASNALEYHRWDAYCRNSQLVVETDGTPCAVAVYSTDGTTVYNSTVTGGISLPLPTGLYIVVSDDFARRVIVK